MALIAPIAAAQSDHIHSDNHVAEMVVVFVKKPATPQFPDRTAEHLAAVAHDKAVQSKKQAQAARLAAQTVKVVSGGSTDAKIMILKMCESGNNYANKNNPKYRGAYQYDFSTWGGFGGYHDPADAPPEVQDAKFAETYARRGASPWPACGRKAGL